MTSAISGSKHGSFPNLAPNMGTIAIPEEMSKQPSITLRLYFFKYYTKDLGTSTGIEEKALQEAPLNQPHKYGVFNSRSKTG